MIFAQVGLRTSKSCWSCEKSSCSASADGLGWTKQRKKVRIVNLTLEDESLTTDGRWPKKGREWSSMAVTKQSFGGWLEKEACRNLIFSLLQVLWLTSFFVQESSRRCWKSGLQQGNVSWMDNLGQGCQTSSGEKEGVCYWRCRPGIKL